MRLGKNVRRAIEVIFNSSNITFEHIQSRSKSNHGEDPVKKTK